MNDLTNPPSATIRFASASEAERNIAGVSAVGRIARELAEAGYSELWLPLPAGQRLGRSALADLARLAPSLRVRLGESPAGAPSRALPGDRLIPARLLAGSGAPPEGAGLSWPEATAEILRGTVKPGDGLVSRWINRPISRRISTVLLRVPGLLPGHATAGTALLGLLMIAALVGVAAPWGLIAGAVLFQAASVFDGVDGEMARATFRSSRRGAMLDSAIDVATNLLLIVGLTISLARAGHEDAVALAGWGGTLFVLGIAMIAWRAVGLHESFSLDLVKHHYRDRPGGQASGALMRWATIVTSRDFFALLFAVLILIGWPMAVLYLFATATTIWLAFVAVALLAPRAERPAADRT